jgi:hypothetical protein
MLDEFYEWIQWPAMALTVLASWQVGSSRRSRRWAGFWVFLASNAAWAAWAWNARAWALLTLQVALALMNVRGMRKADDPPAD